MADEFVWSQGLLVLFYPADMLALLYPVDLRSFFTCSKSTPWQKTHPYLSSDIKQVMSSHRQQHEAATAGGRRTGHPSEGGNVLSSCVVSSVLSDVASNIVVTLGILLPSGASYNLFLPSILFRS